MRKLAAIMFTDIVGYTALTASDEEKAFQLLNTQREVLKPIVKEFGGSWLKEIGDGLLLTFPTVSNAVRCAIKIQQETKEIEGYNLRIGIHEGEIIEEGGDVFGDDVNIASRLEPFSAAGGVAISDKVQRDISSNPEFTTKYIGQPKLKGVRQEVKVYCITSHGLPETKLSDVSAKLEKQPRYWIKWAIPATAVIAAAVYFLIPNDQEVPSIGILPMENLGAQEDEFWARGITEDVIIEVASAGLIRVAPMKEILEFVDSNVPLEDIAKKLRVRYLLLSSLYKKESQFDLRTQLIEAVSGKSIYAKKWSEPSERASIITGTLAENILKSLGVSTKSDITSPPTTNIDAYEFYLRGKYRLENWQHKEDLEIARGLLYKAIELDDSLFLAKFKLAYSYEAEGAYKKSLAIYQDCLEQSKNIGRKKYEAQSHREIGSIYIHQGDYDKAQAHYDNSLEISQKIGDRQEEASSLMGVGYSYYWKHLHDKAIDYAKQALAIARELGDRKREISYLAWIGITYRNKPSFPKSLEYLGQALLVSTELGDRPSEMSTLYSIAITHYSAGDYDKAVEYNESALKIAKELGDRDMEAEILKTLGLHYRGKGDLDYSLDYLEEALSITQELGDKEKEGHILRQIGINYNLRGEFDFSIQYIAGSLNIMQEIGSRFWMGLSHTLLGNVYATMGEYNKALKHYDQALKVKRELEDNRGIASSLHSMGVASLLGGNYPQSSAYFDSACKIWNELDDAGQNLWTLSWWALAELRSGNSEVAKVKADEAKKMIESTNPEDWAVVEVNWNLSQVYSALGDSKKGKQYLEAAYKRVMSDADRLEDQEARERFLTNVRENREVVAAWDKAQL